MFDGMQGNQLGPQPLSKRGLKTLVLDLDETLVRSQFVEQGPYDIELPVKMDDREYRIFVKVRPGTMPFLQEMSKHYEIVIFTASLSKYANPLMDLLDPQTLCTSRLFREHCRFIEAERCYTKDMTLIGRRMEDIILIDNNAVSYKL